MQANKVSFAVMGERGRPSNNCFGLNVSPNYTDSNRIYGVSSTISGDTAFSPTLTIGYSTEFTSTSITPATSFGYFAHSSYTDKSSINSYGFYSDLAVGNGTNFNFFSNETHHTCLLYTSPSPRDRTRSRMPSSA